MTVAPDRPDVQPGTQRLGWVDTGRGLAIALVALYHATNWLSATGIDIRWWQDFTQVLTTMRMPLFFVLSGLFAPKWLSVSWRTLLRSKVLLFVWVFGVWEVVGTVVFPLGLLSGDKPVGFTSLLKGLLLAPVQPRFELWFIWALALFFVVARASRAVDPRIQLALAGVMSLVGTTLWSATTTGWTGSAKFYFFFLVGMYGRRWVLAVGERRQPVLLAAVVLIWGGLSTVTFVLGWRAVPGVFLLSCLLGVAAGIVLSRALTRIRWIGAIGRRTLPIYLAHTPIILALTFVLALSPFEPALRAVPLLWPPLFAAAAVATALALNSWCGGHWTRHLYEPPAALTRLLEPSPGSAR